MQDTIAAIATPTGNGGIGVLRLSGPESAHIAESMLHGACPAPRSACLLPFYDAAGDMIDQGIVLCFPAPHSFTGEDVIELQGHGGAVVMNMLLNSALHFGARRANPGEFSERAFLNDKMDLAQAEAIADLIESGSEMAAKSAFKSLQGHFSEAIQTLQSQLIYARMYVESAIDFPEEEIDFLSEGKIQVLVETLLNSFQTILHKAQQGNVLREGMQVVIAGAPNAGKSSLLNLFAGEETAIVTDIPGTTRDVLTEYLQLDGMPLHLIDTAGIRESDNIIEQEGIRRAIQAVKQADRLLLLVDDRWDEAQIEQAVTDFQTYQVPITLVRNKIDLSNTSAGLVTTPADYPVYRISAKQALGMDALSEHLKACMGYHTVGEDVFMARQRHLDALLAAKTFVEAGFAQLCEHQAGELLADDFYQAQQCLSRITGTFTNDDLLGEIFSRFCIGK